MKKAKLFFISFLTIFPICPLYSQSDTPQTTSQKVPITGNYNKFNPGTPELSAQGSGKIKEIFQKCEQQALSTADPNKPDDSNNENTQNRLNQCIAAETDKIPAADALKMLNEDKENSKEAGPISENRENIKFQSDPAFKKLNDYLSTRLQEALRGKADSPDKTGMGSLGKEKFVDHEVFYDLFQTQLVKSIVALWSSFCINLDTSQVPQGGPLIPTVFISHDADIREKTRAANIKKFEASSSDPANNPHMKDFSICAQVMSEGCKDPVSKNASNDEKYTRLMACVVSKQTRRLKEKMMEMTQLKTKLDKYKKGETNSGINLVDQTQFNGMYEYGNKANEKGINELTSITTGEQLANSGLGKAIDGEITEFTKNCIGSNDLNERCKQLLNSNKDLQRFYQLRKDWSATTGITKSVLKGMSPAQLEDFLKKEGFTPDQIKKIQNTKDATDVIANRYERERQALVNFMNDQLNKSNIEMGKDSKANTKGTIDPVNDPNARQSMLKDIEKNLKQKQQEMAEITFYSNMLMSMIPLQQAGGTGGNKGQGQTADLPDSFLARKELANSAFNSEKYPGYQFSTDKDSFKKIQGGVNGLLGPVKKGKDGTIDKGIDIRPEDINNIFNYDK